MDDAVTPLLQSLSHCSPVVCTCAPSWQERGPRCHNRASLRSNYPNHHSPISSLIARFFLYRLLRAFFLDPSPSTRFHLFFSFLSSTQRARRPLFPVCALPTPNLSPFPRSNNKVSKIDGAHSNGLCVSLTPEIERTFLQREI